MRYLPFIMATYLAVQGCQSDIFTSEPPPRPQVVQNTCDSAPPPDIEQQLAARHALCQLPIEEQRSQLKALAESSERKSGRNAFQRLLLASCHPDLMPGILREALSDINAAGSQTESELYLVQIVKDMDQSSRILEEKNRQLKSDLEKTIEGIRDIESDMGNMDRREHTP
jgi:hypothetical protein